jgi:hypothetical protein
MALVAVTFVTAGDADALTAGALLPDLPQAPLLSPTTSVGDLPGRTSLPSIPALPSLPSVNLSPSVKVPKAPAASGAEAPVSIPSASDRPSTSPVVGQSIGSPARNAHGNEGLRSRGVRTASVISTIEVRQLRTARKLRHELTELDGCLYALTPIERRVLFLLSGVNRRRSYSRAQVAAHLDMSRKRVGRIKRRGLRRLRGTARADGCARSGAGKASVATVPSATSAFSGESGVTRRFVRAQTSPYARLGDKRAPLAPPLPERLPQSSTSTPVGSTWSIILLAIGGAMFLAIAGRELRRLR